MGKKKPKKTSTSSIKDESAQAAISEQQLQRPARKRGRPRKVVIEEKDPPEGARGTVDAQEDHETANDKKPRVGTTEEEQQQKGAESSLSGAAPAGEATSRHDQEKPRRRRRRKGRPQKST